MSAHSEFNQMALIPKDFFVRAAGVWISIFSSFVMQDIAGLSHSKTVAFSYRAPVMFLSTMSAFFIMWALLGLTESWVNKTKSPHRILAKRVWVTIIVALCVAAPIAERCLPIELFAPAACK